MSRRAQRALLSLAGIAAVAALIYTTRGRSAPETPVADAAQAALTPAARPVVALGRLEPKNGVIRVAGPSRPSIVVGALHVDEGDRVVAGQPIAVLDAFAVQEATVTRLRAELENVRAEHRRHASLFQRGVVAVSVLDQWRMREDVALASLREAEAEQQLTVVRAPIDGQVIEIHARSGERVGPDGIAELGQIDDMHAVAEVYETDVHRVQLGQRATITNPGLTEPLHGTVDKIHTKVGKTDVLNNDPTARTDARVVEVEIAIDEDARAAAFTNMQVDVAIVP